MRLWKYCQTINQTFSAKIFIMFTILILFISSTFGAFFILRERRSLRNGLIKEGKILSRVLAYNARLGVFSEHEELLNNSMKGVLQQEEVVAVRIFNEKGDLLGKKGREGGLPEGNGLQPVEQTLNDVLARFKGPDDIVYFEHKGRLEFWAPVVLETDYATEESIFFDGDGQKGNEKIIGLVRIDIDKGGMIQRSRNMIRNSILIGIIFLILGSSAIFFVTAGVTRPLKRLTSAVIDFGESGVFNDVPVTTNDEIGKLATAFNTLSRSLKRREAEKEQLGDQLRQAQKMEAVGTLAGGIAHDFNNILTTIMGYAQIMERKLGSNHPLSADAKNIIESGERAARLTKSLLAYSRKQPLDPRPTRFNNLIADIKKLLVRLIGEDIDLRVNLAQEDLIVLVDKVQMEQVLFNLATNARDAMPGGGVLILKTESADLNGTHPSGDGGNGHDTRYALLTVSDTGVGMSKETLEKIFDPFFTTKGVGKGTGLGLSMVYGIIKQHNGHIDVSSKPQKGTSFRIYLPLLSQAIEETRAETGPDLPVRGVETVLLAEDDEGVRRYSKTILEEYGYTVIDSVDGNDAVQNFMKYKESIRILIFDVIMPRMNGKEAYDLIRKIRPEIKALFLSGYDHNILHTQGMLEEGINFIPKPVSPTLLLKKVREVLDS